MYRGWWQGVWVTLALCLALPAVVSASDIDWISEGTSPLSGGEGQSVVGTDDGVFVVRCSDAPSRCLVYRYSTGEFVWAEVPTEGLPPGAFRPGTALAWDQDESIYALGGARDLDEESAQGAFFRFRAGADEWVVLEDPPFPQGPGNAMVWSGHDAALYAFLGGGSGDESVTVFARFAPSTGVWEELPSKWARTGEGAALVWTGGVYLFAFQGDGARAKTRSDGAFARFDLVAQEWKTLVPLMTPDRVRAGASLVWLGAQHPGQSDFIYALPGGNESNGPGYEFYRYRISADVWDRLPSLPCAVGGFAGNRLAVSDGRLYYWSGTPTTEEWLCGGDAFFGAEIGDAVTPLAQDDRVLIAESAPTGIDVLSNDTDPNGDALRVVEVGWPSHGDSESRETHVVYTPGPGHCGEDSFEYTISDSDGNLSTATLWITVACPGDTGSAEE